MKPRWLPRARRRRPHEVTAFVLGGGGSRGAAQIGMLQELVARGIRADLVYGASVGAVNAAAYCGEPTPDGMVHLEEVWQALDGDAVFPRGRVHGPWRFLQQRASVHPNSGLRKIVEEGVRFDQLEDAVIPLEIVTTSLTDGLEYWITQGPVVDAVLASAAIPALLPPVLIDDQRLVDGGVVNNVPLSRALEAGATRIYVLLCGPVEFRPPIPKRPVEAVMAAFFIAIHARFTRELAAIPSDIDVFVFETPGEFSAQYQDFSATPHLIEQGRLAVRHVLDGDPLTVPSEPADAPDDNEPTLDFDFDGQPAAT